MPVRQSRRRQAGVLLGVPLAFAAIWLATPVLRGADDPAAGAEVKSGSQAASQPFITGEPFVRPEQASAALAVVPVPSAALSPQVEQAVRSSDPAARAEALYALATAPRERALPILQRLLKDGAYPDRQLVIESLAVMARTQGDADERIRTAFRVEIFDGSDEATSGAAEKALADLEEDLR